MHSKLKLNTKPLDFNILYILMKNCIYIYIKKNPKLGNRKGLTNPLNVDPIDVACGKSNQAFGVGDINNINNKKR